mmetsp:Transcript_68691/g.126624  ORF Transcript_68691/g.126624 Transcript_68691/m.126624 type:complete len:202 (+) Transcript_68691:81-686(+)
MRSVNIQTLSPILSTIPITAICVLQSWNQNDVGSAKCSYFIDGFLHPLSPSLYKLTREIIIFNIEKLVPVVLTPIFWLIVKLEQNLRIVFESFGQTSPKFEEVLFGCISKPRSLIIAIIELQASVIVVRIYDSPTAEILRDEINSFFVAIHNSKVLVAQLHLQAFPCDWQSEAICSSVMEVLHRRRLWHAVVLAVSTTQRT